MSSPVVFADPDDPAMLEAMEGARSTFKYLWRELTWEYRRIIPALEMSAVKAAFSDPGRPLEDTEHMWLSELRFDGESIAATLLNAPNQLTSVAEGDRVEMSLDQIEDWMYVLEGRVYGGFTIQVMRAAMSAAERADHDAAWDLKFPDPSTVDLVPNWDGAEDVDAEHPMSENMAPKLAEALAQDRERFFVGDEDGLNALHSLALGGSAAGVRILLEHGADPHTKTQRGHTPRDLAALMGWTRVVELLADAERSH